MVLTRCKSTANHFFGDIMPALLHSQRSGFGSKRRNPCGDQVSVDEHGACSLTGQKFTCEREFSRTIRAGDVNNARCLFHVQRFNR